MSSCCEKPLVEILLATRDGESYLVEQLDSLLAQTYRPIRVLVHDDGSQDKTIAILKSYQDKCPDFFHVIEDEVVELGPVKNFEYLMKLSSADYVMFCDQDDVWFPEKTEIMVESIREVEKNFPIDPVLIHCDLEVVDTSLKCIAPSFFSYQRLPTQSCLPRQLIQNNITGCATILNRKSINISLPIPDSAVMHDWWIACKILKYGGSIHFISTPLVKYRQHQKNAIGAKGHNAITQLKKFLDVNKWWGDYSKVMMQAASLGYTGFGFFVWLTLLKVIFFFRRT